MKVLAVETLIHLQVKMRQGRDKNAERMRQGCGKDKDATRRDKTIVTS